MKKRKTFSRISMLLVCAAIALATAVGGVSVFSKKEKADAAIGELRTFDEFTIAGFRNYYSPTIKSIEEQTRDLARSGLNWIDCPIAYYKLPGEGGDTLDYDADDWRNLNELCRELNIWFSYDSKNGIRVDTAEDAVNMTQDLDRCIGYYVKDEPSAAQFQTWADVCVKLHELDPTRFPYVNLFPNYAGASNLGGSYEDYVRNWVATGGETIEY